MIEALRDGTRIADPKLEAPRVFAEIINETRGWPSEWQANAFLAAGDTRQTVLEVIFGTSLKLMANDYLYVSMDSPPNMKIFAKNHGFSFPYRVDEDKSAGKAYGAVYEPDFFGFNKAN